MSENTELLAKWTSYGRFLAVMHVLSTAIVYIFLVSFFFFGEYEGALISTTTRPCYFVLIIFFKLNKSPKGAYFLQNDDH